MESNELSVELEGVELEGPQTADTELVEFDDLDTIKFPAHRPASVASDVEIEIEIEDDDALEIELGADDVETLLTSPRKAAQ